MPFTQNKKCLHDESGALESEIEILLDAIQKYNDQLEHYYNNHTGIYLVIDGLISGVAAGIVLLAVAPEAAAVGAGVAIEGIAEQSIATGIISVLGYISGALGAARSMLELTVGLIETAGISHINSSEKNNLKNSLDLTDSNSLVAGAGAVVYDNLSNSGLGGPEAALQKGIFAGKVASLSMELSALGNAMRRGTSAEIWKENFQSTLQTATLGSPPSTDHTAFDRIKIGSSELSDFSSPLEHFQNSLIPLHSLPYSDLLSTDGTENGLHIGTLGVSNKVTGNSAFNEPSWHNNEIDPIKEVESLVRSHWHNSFYSMPMAFDFNSFYDPNQSNMMHNWGYLMPGETFNQAPESNLPFEMGGSQGNSYWGGMP